MPVARDISTMSRPRSRSPPMCCSSISVPYTTASTPRVPSSLQCGARYCAFSTRPRSRACCRVGRLHIVTASSPPYVIPTRSLLPSRCIPCPSEWAARLLNPDGTLKPFRQWADDVKSISSHYVGAWLRTEYDTALIRAHNAADWQQFIRDADVMPNLRWMPTTSPMPESSHRAFWERKLTLPVSDPFWDEHHPGDRWNCKCSLQQTDDPPTPELKAEFAGEATQPGLTNNPGKDGHTFSQDHPYFPKSCASCGFYKKASIKNRLLPAFLNIRAKDCYDCPYINNCIPGKGKVEKQREAQQQAAAHIKAFRATLDPYRGTTLHNNDFVSGKLTILRRSMQDVFEHNREDLKLMAWLKDFDLEHIKGWKYKGWAENRPYDSSHPKFDPKNPNKRKHPETEYFLYYSLEIDGDTYWANVKMRKDYGEVLYTIEKKKPEDLILGLKR